MFLYTSELLEVTNRAEYFNLLLRGTRYDIGLRQEVECSQQISISKDHMHLVPTYKDLVGKQITIPVSIQYMKKTNQLWIRTAHDGQPLEC